VSDLTSMIDQALARHKQAIEGCVAADRATLASIADAMADCLGAGGKVLSCGNGGSACDAMHFAGELVGRFVTDRRPLPAIALSADPGILTAIGNDYGFEEIFARQVRAHGRAGDMLVAISTSGQSPNILKALEAARTLQIKTVLLTGEKAVGFTGADWIIAVPSRITAHIQETHIFLLQLMIALVERRLFNM
jgi:D-sedoheptulose 7-phosphate isomerase